MLSTPPTSERELRDELELFRKLYFATVAVTLAAAVASQLPYAAFAFSHGASVPYFFFELRSPWIHAALGALASACLALLAIGRRPQWAALAALAFSLAYFHDANHLRSIGVVNRIGRESCLLFVLLALFLIRPAGRAELAAFRRVLRLSVCLPYFSAGVYKIFHGGTDWWSGAALQLGFLTWHVADGSRISLFLAERAWLCSALSAFAIAVELLSPLAVIFEGLGPALFFYAVGFHVSIRLLMGPNFLEFFLPAFVIFILPWRPLAALRGRLRLHQ